MHKINSLLQSEGQSWFMQIVSSVGCLIVGHQDPPHPPQHLNMLILCTDHKPQSISYDSFGSCIFQDCILLHSYILWFSVACLGQVEDQLILGNTQYPIGSVPKLLLEDCSQCFSTAEPNGIPYNYGTWQLHLLVEDFVVKLYSDVWIFFRST